SGEYAAARPVLEQVLAIRQRSTPDHPDISSTIEVQGDVLFLDGDVQEARVKWNQGLALVERVLRSDHPARVGFQRRLALAADVWGYRAESGQLLERGLKIGERSLAPCNRELLGLREYLASSLNYDGEFVQARKSYDQELMMSEKCFGASHSFTATVI